MAVEERRVFPHRTPDEAWKPLLEWARRATERLVGLSIPNESFDERREDEPYDHVTRTLRFGDASRGLELVLREEYVEMGVITTSAHRMKVRAFGFPDGRALTIESLRPPNTPAFLRVLTARIEGPDDVVRALAEELVPTFRLRTLTSDEHEALLRCARHRLRPYVWDVAIEYATLVLEHRPDDVDAQFVLGIALGATGDLSRAQQLLRTVVERRPDDYDAWYNLGIAHATHLEHAAAATCFESALRASPDNHAVLYQLACAREALGDRARALEAYRKAVDASPNPRGAFHYMGMDFTEKAQAAIARLGAG